MKPAAFEMERPRSLAEALSLLAGHGDAKLLAGGQSLVPAMNFRLATPTLVIDLDRVEELRGIRRDGDWLRIGAMTRQRELLASPLVAQHAPLLRQAIPYVGHVQTRARGTLGGSLAHADPSAELPLVMVALDALFSVQRVGGMRSIPARQFFTGAMTTELAPDEILTEIAVPIAPAGSRCSFRELARRHGDFAIVAVAVQFDRLALSIAIGSLESRPRYCRDLALAIAAQNFSRATLPALISAELSQSEPLSDLAASGDYRRALAAVLLEDCLEDCLGEVLRS